MNHSDFDSNIQDLNSVEIESVDGGILPLLVIAYVGIGLSVGTLIVGTGVVVGLHLSKD